MIMPGATARWAFAFVALALAVKLIAGLTSLPFYYFDESHYVNAGQSLWDGIAVENWEHPPLGKYFILAGRLLFADKVFGARLPAALAALLSLIPLALIAESIARGKWARGLAASLAASLALTDSLFFNLGKMAMLDIFLLFFTVWGLWFAMQYTERPRASSALGFSICFGLALACKWTALPVFAVVALLTLNKKALPLTLAVAGAVYCCTFWPYTYFLHVSWTSIAQLHISMLHFHESFASSPRLGWMGTEWLFETGDGGGIAATISPFAYFFGVAGLLCAAISKKRGRFNFVLILSAAATPLFWLTLGRHRDFHMHYLLPMAPMVYLGAIQLLSSLNLRQHGPDLYFQKTIPSR